MELDEFTEARASVETIQAEYKEVEKNELEWTKDLRKAAQKKLFLKY